MPTPEIIRTLVVDDHLMMAEGLRAAISTEPDLEVVGVAHDVPEAYELVEQLKPDVVLMDYSMPSGDGLSCAQKLKADHPDLRVLIVTGHHDDSIVVRAVEEGCDGFLRKTASVDEVVAAVRRVHSGEAVFSARDLALVVRRMRTKDRDITALTDREIEVLQRMANGASTEAMAEGLFVSTHTVRSHVRHILSKLGAHSKLEAVAIAIREGLVEVEPA